MMSVFRMVKDLKIETVEVELGQDWPDWMEAPQLEVSGIAAPMARFIEINGKEFPLEAAPMTEATPDRSVTRLDVAPETAQEIKGWIDSGHQIITRQSYPTCPKCGATGDDDWDYCPYDGARLDPAGEPERYEVDRYGKRVDDI